MAITGVRSFLYLLLGGLVLPTTGVLAASAGNEPIHYTYPQPPKVKPDDPLHVYPAFQVPEHLDRYTWKVTGKLDGKVIYPQSVPLYEFDDNNDRSSVDEIPVGTVIKLEFVRRYGNIHYYEVPSPKDPSKTAWISGLYVEAAGYTPSDQ